MDLKLWEPYEPVDENPLSGAGASSNVLSATCLVERLYTRDGSRIGRFFRRHVTRSEDVPDLVHRVFVKLLGLGSSRLQSVERPSAFLSTIAANVMRDEWREAGRRPLSGVSWDSDDMASEDPHPQLEARDMLNRVDDAMLALPERTREIFMANRFDGMTYKEIAARTGLSVKTVEKHMSRALFALQILLADDE